MNDITRAILAWHEITARDLPWRGERDPYRVYVSEIMLQQTRTATVKRYYAPFLAAFPDPLALAQASEDAVNKMWEGLGYYSRARNLQRAMKMVMEDMGGRFPDTRESLLALPGCGEYVSGAVASIAFGQRELALDGNGIRVLCRILGEERDTGDKQVRRALAEYGESLLPQEGAGEFNQALMGMGNLVCLPKKALCGECPAAPWCRGYARGIALKLPVKAKRPEKKAEGRAVAVVVENGRVWVRKRTEKLLCGLYEFVNLPVPQGDSGTDGLARAGIPAESLAPLGEYEHVFTHKIWRMEGYAVRGHWDAPAGYERMDREALMAAAMPSAMNPFRRAAEEML